MSKKYYCEECGLRLEVKLKAVPSKGIVVSIVKPHVCEDTKSSDLEEVVPEETVAEEPEKKLNFDIPFVPKLNKASAETEIVGLKDKRSKEHLRSELVTSTAPIDALNAAKNQLVRSVPAHDLEEPKDV